MNSRPTIWMHPVVDNDCTLTLIRELPVMSAARLTPFSVHIGALDPDAGLAGTRVTIYHPHPTNDHNQHRVNLRIRCSQKQKDEDGYGGLLRWDEVAVVKRTPWLVDARCEVRRKDEGNGLRWKDLFCLLIVVGQWILP